jgi:hypothetical protein
MDYFEKISKILNAAIALTDTTGMAVIGTHSLPLWLKGLPQPVLPESILQEIQLPPLRVDICLYSGNKDISAELDLLNTSFSVDSRFTALHNVGLNAYMDNEVPANVDWFSRCKKVRIGRYSLPVMHPVDTYYFLQQTNPSMARKLISCHIIKPNMLSAVKAP